MPCMTTNQLVSTGLTSQSQSSLAFLSSKWDSDNGIPYWLDALSDAVHSEATFPASICSMNGGCYPQDEWMITIYRKCSWASLAFTCVGLMAHDIILCYMELRSLHWTTSATTPVHLRPTLPLSHRCRVGGVWAVSLRASNWWWKRKLWWLIAGCRRFQRCKFCSIIIFAIWRECVSDFLKLFLRE